MVFSGEIRRFKTSVHISDEGADRLGPRMGIRTADEAVPPGPVSLCPQPAHQRPIRRDPVPHPWALDPASQVSSGQPTKSYYAARPPMLSKRPRMVSHGGLVREIGTSSNETADMVVTLGVWSPSARCRVVEPGCPVRLQRCPPLREGFPRQGEDLDG